MRHLIRSMVLTATLCVAFAIPAPALAQSEGAANLSRLTKPITLKVDEARFEDIVEFIRTSTGASIDVAWISERHIDGLDPEALVSLRVESAQSLSVLLHASGQASADDLEGPTWQIDHQTGAVQIGPRSRLNKFKRLEIYDIHDLILVLPDYDQVPELNLNSVLRQGQGGGGTGIFQQTQGQPTNTDPAGEAQNIMEILQAVIEPDQWIDNGGSGATVRFYDGNLLVSAPDYIHRQINGYAFLAGPVGRPALGGTRATSDTDAAEAEQAKDASADSDQ